MRGIDPSSALLWLGLLGCRGDTFFKDCDDEFDSASTRYANAWYEAAYDCGTPLTLDTGGDTGWWNVYDLCESNCRDVDDCVNGKWGCDATTHEPIPPPSCDTFTVCILASN